jgi:hypothetical protein
MNPLRLLDLSITLASAAFESTMRKDGAPIIDYADCKALSRFAGALNKLDSHHIHTTWSRLTIWQRLLIAEAARRSGNADALSAVVGELPVPGEHLPKTKARPEPMF